MVLGTALVTYGGFSSVVDIDLWVAEVRVYAAVVALVANLAVALALTPLADRLRVPRGIDATAATENVDQARWGPEPPPTAATP